MKLTPSLLLLGTLLTSSCSVPSLRVAPRYGTFDMTGDFGIQTGAVSDVPTADLETAGVSKDDGFLGVKAELDIGAPVFTISTQVTDHSGSGVLDTDLSSGGDSISAGTPVDNDIQFGLHQFAATFDFVPGDTIDVGLGLGVTVADLNATMTDGVETLSTDELLPIPVLALRGQTVLGRFEASAMISGMAVELDGNELQFIDYEVEARWRLFGGDKHLAGEIGAGYRGVDLSVDFEDDGDSVSADFLLQGPYVQFAFSF